MSLMPSGNQQSECSNVYMVLSEPGPRAGWEDMEHTGNAAQEGSSLQMLLPPHP